ncbi:cobalamin B12-binding domain-containing protein [Muricoccus vinaceus]|uniref:B12-binding domain-containing protein n=1 Tax=Muricoccus vinaceus TaxID=424704 RepID=A0ABV6J0P3_9PROT
MGEKPMEPGTAEIAGKTGGGRHHAPDDAAFYASDTEAGEAPARGVVRDAAVALGQRLVLLARTIETEVVPRLVLVHRAPPSLSRARTPPVRAKDITRLAASLLAHDTEAAAARVEEVRSRGATLEHVSLDLMAPVARRLGEMWADDDCTYTDVTLGVWRLQQLLRGLSPVFQPQSDPARGEHRRALIVAMPGEDHSFGTDIVAGLLRLSGWEVCNEPAATGGELSRRVRRERFAIVGLSAGCSDDLTAMAALIAGIRRAAGGQAIGVMVGGYVFTQQPQGALRVGADAVALDARHAVRQAESLLGLLGAGH